MMDHKLIIGMVGLFAVLLAGCTSTQQTANQGNTTPPAPAPQKQYLCDDGKTIVADLSTCPPVDKDLLDCEKASATADFNGDSDRDSCYYQLAVDRANVTLCKKVHNSGAYAKYSAGKCGAEIAMSAGDPSMCDQLGLIFKSDCYSEIAKETSDPSVCTKISVADKKDECIYDYVSTHDYLVKDWSICGNISSGSYQSSYCYQLAATNTKNAQYCDKIGGSSGGIYSYSKPDCYGKVAKDTVNPGLCEGLQTTPDKDECFYQYGATYPYDTSVCSRITDQYKRDDCNYYGNQTRYY